MLPLRTVASRGFAIVGPLASNGAFATSILSSRSPVSKYAAFASLGRRWQTGPAYPASAATRPGATMPTPPQLPGKPRVVSSKGVAWWLLGSAAAVFGIVVLGGLTRLTESGLSITEWRPVTGAMPPRTHEAWEAEFTKYKASPEYQQLNPNMTLDEYKFIYYMEWGHRLWGRAIGLLVLLPGAWFVLKRRTSPSTNRKLAAITVLLGLQGAVGWWMVYSGLDRTHLESRTDTQPRVSHYRLATHLTLALVLYAAMASEGLAILRAHKLISNPIKAAKELSILGSPLATPMRRAAWLLLGLALVTSVSGSFVAGLDAGLLYNSFPLMGNGLTPPLSELYDQRYGRSDTTTGLVVGNNLDNPVTVQLNHRILAVTTWTATLLFFIAARKHRNLLPRSIYKGAHGAIGFATLQAALGITTLLYVAPVPLAASHQAGALLFLTSLLILLNRIRLPRAQLRKLIEVMAQHAERQAKK